MNGTGTKAFAKLSVVIPAYGEAAQILNNLQTILGYLRNHYQDDEYEVIVVDDGSTDATKALVLELGVEHSRNNGPLSATPQATQHLVPRNSALIVTPMG